MIPKVKLKLWCAVEGSHVLCWDIFTGHRLTEFDAAPEADELQVSAMDVSTEENIVLCGMANGVVEAFRRIAEGNDFHCVCKFDANCGPVCQLFFCDDHMVFTLHRKRMGDPGE